MPHLKEQPFPWILAYFRQIYANRVEQTQHGIELVPLAEREFLVESLHLAYSRDGFHWTAFNGNEPVWVPPAEMPVLRDPFVRRGVDGAFHLVGTGGTSRTSCTYARSRDLVTWDGVRSLELMDGVPNTRNVWAPEFFFDAASGRYLLYWSSSQSRHGWDESRIWCAWTADFREIGEPRVLFDPGYSVIDATIMPWQGRQYMFHKEEMFGQAHGERRAIRVATAERLEGPYAVRTGPVTRTITEGPAVARLPDRRWALLYDYCMADGYGVSVSEDLLVWDEVMDVRFPPNARHGSVSAVTEEELVVLMERFG
jgi:hypothetical protein